MAITAAVPLKKSYLLKLVNDISDPRQNFASKAGFVSILAQSRARGLVVAFILTAHVIQN